jgi:hypothetical protein
VGLEYEFAARRVLVVGEYHVEAAFRELGGCG